MALLKQYFKLRNEYREKYGEKTLLLMEVGSFYEVYTNVDPESKEINEPQVIDLQRYAELTPGKKTESIFMLGFSSRNPSIAEKYIEKIINNGYTVVVYNQVGEGDNITRERTGIYSPGTYFNEKTDNISNNISCIWVEKHTKSKFNKSGSIVIGMSNIDIFTGKSSFYEMTTENLHNPTTYDELERFISTCNPNETLIISNIIEKEIADIIQYTGLSSKKSHIFNTSDTKVKNAEKQTYQREILCKFFSTNIGESLFYGSMEYTFAVQSYVFLLNFVYEHNASLLNKIQEPLIENNTHRMTLANHSLKQLNIISDGNYSGKLSSVCSLLNNCITTMGIRMFNHNLLTPTTDREKLIEKYNITEHLISIKLWTKWRKQLKDIKDIEKFNRRIYSGKITPYNMSCFFENLSIIRDIFIELECDKRITTYLSNDITLDIVNMCDIFQSLFKKTFNMDICKTITSMEFDTNFINKGINNDLDKYADSLLNGNRKLEAIRIYLNNSIHEIENKTKSDYIKLHETEKSGISLQCTSRRSTILKKQIEKGKFQVNLSFVNDNNVTEYFSFNPDIHVDKASASNVTIVNSEILTICNNITNAKQKMKDTIHSVYKNFISSLENYNNYFQNLILFCSNIDMLQNMCYIAVNNKYCKPDIKSGDKSYVNAKQIRHPLIEKLNTDELYVANDVSIGTNNDIMLLYGTNAVGKTSIIRALGINIIMAQSGLYVPSEEFEFVPYKSIYTRILGNDNLFKGLSTFAVEMSELRVILNTADKYSLILGDELCSGTEHDSAVSIFVSGLEMLSTKQSSAVFATHLHEITEYDEIKSLDNLIVKHMSVQYEPSRDILIYDRILRDGPGTSMYGLEVCKSLHLPRDFLDNAYKLRRKYNKKETSILEQKTSHFNSKKIMGMCELCKNEYGDEVHHLQHQEKADKNNMINNFHKNHPANLLTLCEKCHLNIHKSGKQHKKTKTSIGIEISEISE